MNNAPAEVRVAQTNAVAQIVSAAIAKGLIGKLDITTYTVAVARAIKDEL